MSPDNPSRLHLLQILRILREVLGKTYFNIFNIQEDNNDNIEVVQCTEFGQMICQIIALMIWRPSIRRRKVIVLICNFLQFVAHFKVWKGCQEARGVAETSQSGESGQVVRWASKISAGEILIGESRHNPDVSRTSSDQPQHSTNNRSSCAAPSCGLELRNVEFFKVTSWRTGSKQPKSPLDAVLSYFTLPIP